MIATDELCRMLAEMGVEYVLDEEYGKKYPPEQRVTWSCDLAGEDMTVTARDYCIGRDEGGEWEYCLDLEFHEVFTPAQAVEATLGRSECRFRTVERFIDARRSRADMCECDRCGYRCARGFIQDERFKYCPNCGARIEVDG